MWETGFTRQAELRTDVVRAGVVSRVGEVGSESSGRDHAPREGAWRIGDSPQAASHGIGVLVGRGKGESRRQTKARISVGVGVIVITTMGIGMREPACTRPD